MSNRGPVRSSLVALGSALRHLPLFFRETPRTPLRVLCIAALDAVHVLRYSRPIPRARIRALIDFLDFGACINAEWDRKPLHECEHQAARDRLEAAGFGDIVREYLARLRELEIGRPPLYGDHRRFDEVREYREAVVRVSLATSAAMATNSPLEGELRTIDRDSDLEVLFRIVMQCQIIDDVLDYAEDVSTGLPSFLTATASLPEGVAMAAGVGRAYGARWERTSGPAVLPLRLALEVVTLVTAIIVRTAHLRRRHAEQVATC